MICDYDLGHPMYNFNNALKTRNLHTNLDDDTCADCNLLTPVFDNCTKYVTLEELADINFSSESLTILQLNCRSLKKNFDQLNLLLSNFSTAPQIISLSETWLKPSDQLPYFSIPGYQFISVPRRKKRGGGVGFYISNSLNFVESNCA